MQRSVVFRTAFSFVLVAGFALLLFDRTTAHTVQQAVLQPATQPARQAVPLNQSPVLSKAELDQLVAPVALYPDALLAYVLIASTYPLEVVAADRWANSNKDLAGAKLSEAAAQQTWDASIKALVHAPAVLAIMSKQVAWTNKLGEAVLAQQNDVFDAVQRLRRQATEAGQLQTTAEQNVVEGNPIYIEPVSDTQMYVPYYNTSEAFGLWMWDDNPPFSWPVPAGYSVSKGFIAGAVSGGFWRARVNFADHQLTVNNTVQHFSHRRSTDGEVWRHDPVHRQGVNYSRLDLQSKYGTGGDSARSDFRGYSKQGDATSDLVANLGGARDGDDRGVGFDGIGRGSDMRGFSDRGYASRTKSVAGFRGFRSGSGPSSGRGRGRR